MNHPGRESELSKRILDAHRRSLKASAVT